MRKVWIVAGIALFALTMGLSVVALAIVLRRAKRRRLDRVKAPSIWTPLVTAIVGIGGTLTGLGMTLILLATTETWKALIPTGANVGGVYTCFACLTLWGIVLVLIPISEKKREIKTEALGLPFPK